MNKIDNDVTSLCRFCGSVLVTSSTLLNNPRNSRPTAWKIESRVSENHRQNQKLNNFDISDRAAKSSQKNFGSKYDV